MATASLGGSLRAVFDRVRGDASHGDGELLTRYRIEHDQEAFGSLVRRHGPMVLGVCRRVLRDAHAADDAFQATFLVLAKKANAVRPPDRLAPWLYGVAYRTALKARGRAFRRQQVEQQYAAGSASLGASVPRDQTDAADLLPIIDDQLNALPEKYRAPLVLCGIQGLNKTEAAERLKLPEGTVSSRLARAREMLRDRLMRRGVIVPAAAFAALLTTDTLQAAVPSALVASASAFAGSSVVPATVLTLSQEVIRSMTLLKLKFLGAIALSVSLAGGGFVALQADEKKAQPVPGDVKKSRQVPDANVKSTEPESLSELLDRFDTDKDGQISLFEWRKAGGKLADFQKIDLNSDGIISADELIRFKQKPAKPAPEPEKPAPKFSGHVGWVDEKENTITLVFKGKNGDLEKVIKVTAGAKVFIDGKEGKLADVPVGSMAAFVATGGGKDGSDPLVIAEVRVTGASVFGIVKSVDATSITLESEKVPQSFTLAADGKGRVLIGGKDAKLADLKPGDKVSVTLSADGASALAIATGTKEGEKTVKGLPKFSGRVSRVDAAARTISVMAKGDNEIPVKLTTEAKISIDGKEAKIGDVAKGMSVTFTLVPGKDEPREATEVVVAGPTFEGTIKELDATSITIGTTKRDVALKLLPGTKVTISGKDAKAADLKVSDKITITMTADDSGVLQIVSGSAPKVKPEKGNPEEE